MQQDNRPFLSIVFLIVFLLFLQFGVASTANQSAFENMVTIGNFSMDKYEFPNKIGELPVTDVTWYEAKAMCEEIGKRLCTPDEWVKACRGPKGFRYTYGSGYDPTSCNTDTHAATPMKIGETPSTCVSGYGVYDLNGNVWEWVGLTEDDASIRGGAWSSESCAECVLKFWEYKPNAKSKLAGFRCCK